jgi:hypothetical protein
MKRDSSKRPQKIYHLPRIDVGVDQLDWSIRLLLDHAAYVPAITLAGAAEEILGKPLQGRSALSQLRASIPRDAQKIDLNKLRNFLKHGNPPEMHVSGIELEAALMIIRAQVNLESNDNTFCSEWPRFVDWVRATHPQLFTETAEDCRATL